MLVGTEKREAYLSTVQQFYSENSDKVWTAYEVGMF